MGREIFYDFISEVHVEFLVDLKLGVSEVSHCACLWEEFLDQGYGVWPLGLCCPCQLLRAIVTVFVDVCLGKKVLLGEGAGVYCLPSGGH